ncbi:MAG: recombinase [Rhodobacteraceae bacterium]|nr:recombinase [Paracoccaceae bacterium]
MPEADIQKAVIYCRVSGAKQVREGDGLASQETRCREYARYKGYEVVSTFKDDVSGKPVTRPAMGDMLTYLRQHRADACVVIIDDISRLARGLQAHLELRESLIKAGGKLESPSIEFGEDSDSVFVENLLASVAQHQREKNGEQTKNRMRARFMNGYWVFSAPLGYRYEKTGNHGKLLVRAEPLATIVTEALEGYASGRFQTQAEVKRFLETQEGFPRNRRGDVPQQRVADILRKSLYAGYISHERWKLNLIKAKHEALISYDTFQKIQTRRQAVAQVPTRKNINEDFPLRGFITCGHCENPLTACWSSGQYRRYPYYLCDTKGCKVYRKSIKREHIEGDFEALLMKLRPSQMLFSMAFDMMKTMWDARLEGSKAQVSTMRKALTGIENKTEQFLDRIVETDSDTVIKAYEKRIRDLESEKTLLAEKIGKCGTPAASFDETYRTAFSFLETPHKLWASERLEDRRAVLKLVFADKLSYTKNIGYRTVKTTLPFKALEGFSAGESVMVPRRRLELPRP